MALDAETTPPPPARLLQRPPSSTASSSSTSPPISLSKSLSSTPASAEEIATVTASRQGNHSTISLDSISLSLLSFHKTVAATSTTALTNLVIRSMVGMAVLALVTRNLYALWTFPRIAVTLLPDEAASTAGILRQTSSLYMKHPEVASKAAATRIAAEAAARSSAVFSDFAVQPLHSANVWSWNATLAAIDNDGKGLFPAVDCPTTTTKLPTLHQAFIIAGAQKSGTTALYRLLQDMHPLHNNVTTRFSNSNEHLMLLPSRRFETHFFDETANLRREPSAVLSSSVICRLRNKYYGEFDWSKVPVVVPATNSTTSLSTSSIVTLEKCPVYMCKPRIPYHIRQVWPNAKILLVLRNPIDRAYSHWFMILGSKLNLKQQRHHASGRYWTPTNGRMETFYPSSFEDIVEREIAVLRWLKLTNAPTLETYLHPSANRTQLASHFSIPSDKTLHYRSGQDDIGSTNYHGRKRNNLQCGYLNRGLYASQLYNWHQASFTASHNNLLVLRYEDFVDNKTLALTDISTFIGLPTHHDDSGRPVHESVDVHKDYSPRQENQNSKSSSRMKGSSTLRHLQESSFESSFDISSSSSTTKRARPPPMDPLVREYLTLFYKPYNNELADLLGEKWRNVWT